MPDSVPSILQGEPDLREMFHRLNNQLGVILAHAELLESKASESADRARAAQVVASTLDAMATARDLRRCTEVAGV
jgi:two-component sensor histidine kinase